MPKPSTLPEWATDGDAQVVEPTSGKKAIGWVPREHPPAQYLNWWQRLVYEWIEWLDGERSMVIPAADACPEGGDANWSFTGGFWTALGTSQSLHFPIRLPVGARVTGYTVCADRDGDTVTAALRVGSDGGSFPSGGSASLSAGSGFQVFSSGTIDHTMTAGSQAFVEVVAGASGATKVRWVEVSYEHP